MLIHVPTGAEFRNRKEAKELIGNYRFKKLARKGEFKYVFEEPKKEESR